MQEAQLIKQAQKGNQESFCSLIECYEKKIFNIAYKFMRNEQDAQDAAQEAIIKIYTNLQMYSFNSSFSTWMYRVTANVCMDLLRKRKANVGIEDFENVFVSTEGNPASDTINRELGENIKKAIYMLPEKYISVIVLKDVNGFKYEEIAEILKLSIGTVKSRIARAREKLRDILINKGVI